MSKPGTPDDPVPNSTRQMLDELDALMERMLALPVNDLDDPPAAPSPLSAKVTIVEAPAPEKLPPPVPPPVPSPGKVLVGRLSAPPSYNTEIEEEKPRPKKKPKESRPKNEEIVEKQPNLWEEPLPTPDEILPPLVVKPVPVEELRLPRKRRSFSNILLQPLLGINYAYDRATVLLGPMGRWLRGARGRKCLGLIGLGLLTLAALWWLHDWLGWNWLGDPLE
jgi:hypothetical protein